MAVKPAPIKCLAKNCDCEAYWQTKSDSTHCSHTCDHKTFRHIICNDEEGCNCRKYKKLEPAEKETKLKWTLPCQNCGHKIHSHVMNKKQGIKAIPDFIRPTGCFYMHWDDYRGWQPVAAYGCAHFVAHETGIKRSGGLQCLDRCPASNDALILGLQEIDINDVAKKDIWCRGPLQGEEHGHSGWVSRIDPIWITHLAKGKPVDEVKYPNTKARVTGGKFYGDPRITRYLANLNISDTSRKPEMHDLTNINGKKGKCQVDKIKASKYYSSKEKALSDGLDPCGYCMRGSKK